MKTSNQYPKQKLSLLLLISFIIAVSCVDAQTPNRWQGKNRNFCARPVASKNPLDLKWLVENVKEGYNIQFGNPTASTLVAQLIGGNRNTDTSRPNDPSRACPRLNLISATDTSLNAVYTGYGGRQAPVQCTTRNRNNFECIITSSDKLAVLQSRDYFAYVDGKGKGEHNLVAIVKCLPNGGVMWYVMTVSKTISAEETKTITEYLKSVGFNTDIIVPMQSSSCQRKGGKRSGWGNKGQWGHRRQWG